MSDDLTLIINAEDRTASAFKSAASNARNVHAAALRAHVSDEEMQRRVDANRGKSADKEVKEVKRVATEQEKAHGRVTVVAKRAHDAQVHGSRVVHAAQEQVNEVLKESVIKYLTLGAAIEGAREAFMGFAKEDATMRRMSVTFNKSLHEVEGMAPAWRAAGQAAGASMDEMVAGVNSLGKASNKGLNVTEAAITAMVRGAKVLGVTTRQAGEIQGSFMRNMGITSEQSQELWQQMQAGVNKYQLSIEDVAGDLPMLTSEFRRMGAAGLTGSSQMIAFLGKLEETGNPSGGLMRVIKSMAQVGPNLMKGVSQENWLAELANASSQGMNQVAYTVDKIVANMNEHKIPIEQLGMIVGQQNVKYWDPLIRSAKSFHNEQKQIFEDGKKGEVFNDKLNTVMTGAAAAVKKMGDEFEHMSGSFGQLIAVMGAPSFLEGAAKRFDSIARMIEYISKSDEHKAPDRITTKRNKWGFSTMEKHPDDPDHPFAPEPPLFRWDPKAKRGSNFRNKMIKSGIGMDLFNAATATARIPGNAMGGKYKSEPATSGTLTEEDAFRQNQARDQEGRDALTLSAWGTGARGAITKTPWVKTEEAARLAVPDLVPGGIKKSMGGGGDQAAAAESRKIILPIVKLDNNIERLTKEVASLKSILENPSSGTRFNTRVGGPAPWEARANQRRIEGHVPGEAGPTSGTATGELLGAFSGMGSRGSSGGGAGRAGEAPQAPGGAGSVRGGPSMGGESVSAAPGTPTSGDPRGMIPYIRETAKKYGIDPDIAVRVAKSEGLSNPVGDRGMSHGAFQLYKGGGLGNEFQKKTGLDAADPANERATIDYALQNASQKGWGAFHGAKRVGISSHQGIGGAGGIAASSDVGGARSPGAVSAVGGKDPNAFIFHHTGGRGTVAGVQNTLRQRGLGVQYVMDREGNVVQTGGPGSSHMMRGSGVGAGLSNRNTVGMEVIAKDDRDVTPQQTEAAKEFMRRNYPNTNVFGHGQVNPGHKEATEGKTIVDAVNKDRASPQEQGPQQPRAMSAPVPGLEEYRKAREEMERPIPLSFKRDSNQVQFARASAAREHDRELRESRYQVNSDIGAG